MFYRNCLQYLRLWRNREDRKPLILRGARQVGKTTVVNEFAKDFEQYVYLNLEKEEDKRLFNNEIDIERTLQAISYTKRIQISGSTLIFIDEIQNSSIAVQSLRYLYEEHPKLCVIAAGSLLESYAGRNFSFPVGRVEYYAMRPCTFYEYLSAIGEEADKQAILEQKGHLIHNRLMHHFQMFTLLGGMPEVIKRYIDTGNLRSTESVYRSLLTAYQDDVEKYAQNKSQIPVIRHILQYGWSQAGEVITYERFAGTKYKSREVGEAFLTLQKSMLLETVYPSPSVALYESKIIPIEVKSCVNARLKSLQQFMALSQYDIAVRIWSKPFEVNDIVNPLNGKVYRLLNIPFYMVGMLDELLNIYI